MLTDPLWLGGGLLLFLGLGYEVVAFSAMPLAVAQPIFAVALVGLVAYAVRFLGERLSTREWTSVALFVLATMLIGLSATEEGELHADATLVGTLTRPWMMIAICTPAVLIAALVWLVGDRRASGRHARKLAGCRLRDRRRACAGLAEAGIRGISLVYRETGSLQAVLESAYPWLTIGLAAIALGQLQVALQRCRVAIVAVVLTVIGRSSCSSPAASCSARTGRATPARSCCARSASRWRCSRSCCSPLRGAVGAGTGRREACTHRPLIPYIAGMPRRILATALLAAALLVPLAPAPASAVVGGAPASSAAYPGWRRSGRRSSSSGRPGSSAAAR